MSSTDDLDFDEDIQEFISNSSSFETTECNDGGSMYSSPTSNKSQYSTGVRTPSSQIRGHQRTSSFGSRPQSMEQGSTSSLYIKRQPRSSNQNAHQHQNKIAALSPETPHNAHTPHSTHNAHTPHSTYTPHNFQSSRNPPSPNMYEHTSHFGSKNINQRHLQAEDLDIKPLMSSPSNTSVQGTRSRSGSARARPMVLKGIGQGGAMTQPTVYPGNYQSKYLKVDSSDEGDMRISNDSVPSEHSDEDIPPLSNSSRQSSSSERKRKFMGSQETRDNQNLTNLSNHTSIQSNHSANQSKNLSNYKVSQSNNASANQTTNQTNIYSLRPESPSPRSILIRKKNPVIKNYVIGDLLGQGGNGRVHLSFNSDSGEFFAIKEVTFSNLSPSVLDDKLQALQREITVMKSLDHENIVRYYGAEKNGTNLYIFLEYIPGGSLASLVNRYGRLSEEVCKKFTKQILLGLDYLHKNRIIHRDIKGANILINVEGIAKVADFGASRQIANIMSFTQDFQTLSGTPHFMAPEVILQTGHGRSADIWSVGCTVTEMCTGKPPFAEYKTAAAVMYHIASTNDLPKLPDFLSPEAKNFLERCFVRERTKRATAEELLRHPWLRNIETPLERKMANIGHPMDGPSINNLIIQIQTEDKTQLAKETVQKEEKTFNENRTTVSTPTNSTRPKHVHSELSQTNLKNKVVEESTFGNNNLPLPHVNVADSVDFKQFKKDRSDSFNSLNLSQDDILTAQREPESAVEYGSPRLGYDDHADISNFLKRKSDIQNKSMLSMDLSGNASPTSSITETPPRESTETNVRLSSRRKARSNNPAFDLSVETGEDDEFPVHQATITTFTSPSPAKFSPDRNILSTPSPLRYEENDDEKKIAASNAQMHRVNLELQEAENKKKKSEEQRKQFEEEQRRYLEEQAKEEQEMGERQINDRPNSGLSGKNAPRRTGSGRKRSNSTNSSKSTGKSSTADTGPDRNSDRSMTDKSDTSEKKSSEKDRYRSVSRNSKGERIVKPSSSDKSTVKGGASDKALPRQSSRENSTKPSYRTKSNTTSKGKSSVTPSSASSGDQRSPRTKSKPRSKSVIRNG